jgi:methylmalonyl-CoA mutase N-terminal domain/subunit
MGGALAAIEQGYPQREIHESAARYQQAVEEGNTVVVGVNRFADEASEHAPPILRIDPAVRDRQIARLREVRERRDPERVAQTLRALEEAARGSRNTMPFILAAVEAYASIGEICDVLRRAFGEERALTRV